MNFDKALLIALLWVYSVGGALFFGHELGLMNMKHERVADSKKLQACQKILVGIQ